MSDVQRFFPGDDGVLHPLGADEFPGHGYMSVADHERVVAELREAHEKALRESVQQSEDIHTRNLASTYDTAYATGVDDERVRWMVATQQAGDLLAASVKATFAANPRTLTADENYRRGLTAARVAVVDVWHRAPAPFGEFVYREVLPAIDALIHDSGKQPLAVDEAWNDIHQFNDADYSAKYGMCGGCGKDNEKCCGGCKESLCRRCPERIATGEVPAADDSGKGA